MKFQPANLKVFLFMGLIVPLLFSACKKEEEDILLEIPYRVFFDMNAGLDPFQVHYFQINGINNQMQSLLKDRGLTLDDVSGVEAGDARILAEFAGVSYRFIREISVRVYEEDPSDPSKWREMWYRDDINLLDEDDQLDLIPSLADGFPLLQEEQFNLSIVIQLREVTPSTMSNQLDFTLFVR
jgi:hypothetical protein